MQEEISREVVQNSITEAKEKVKSLELNTDKTKSPESLQSIAKEKIDKLGKKVKEWEAIILEAENKLNKLKGGAYEEHVLVKISKNINFLSSDLALAEEEIHSVESGVKNWESKEIIKNCKEQYNEQRKFWVEKKEISKGREVDNNNLDTLGNGKKGLKSIDGIEEYEFPEWQNIENNLKEFIDGVSPEVVEKIRNNYKQLLIVPIMSLGRLSQKYESALSERAHNKPLGANKKWEYMAEAFSDYPEGNTYGKLSYGDGIKKVNKKELQSENEGFRVMLLSDKKQGYDKDYKINPNFSYQTPVTLEDYLAKQIIAIQKDNSEYLRQPEYFRQKGSVKHEDMNYRPEETSVLLGTKLITKEGKELVPYSKTETSLLGGETTPVDEKTLSPSTNTPFCIEINDQRKVFNRIREEIIELEGRKDFTKEQAEKLQERLVEYLRNPQLAEYLKEDSNDCKKIVEEYLINDPDSNFLAKAGLEKSEIEKLAEMPEDKKIIAVTEFVQKNELENYYINEIVQILSGFKKYKDRLNVYLKIPELKPSK